MSLFLPFPKNVPADQQNVWLRIVYWNAYPFLAIYDEATSEFIEVAHGFRYPLWSVMSWKPAEPDISPYMLLDGVFYPSVKIGNLYWLSRNLIFNDGLGDIFSPNGNSANDDAFGLLYLQSILSRISAQLPSGWRVCSDADIADLAAVYPYSNSNPIRSVGTTYWPSPNSGATNESGLSVRANGYYTDGGSYSQFKNYAFFFSSVHNHYVGVNAVPGNFSIGTDGSDSFAMGIRCVLDV